MKHSVYLSIGTNKGDKISNCKLVIKKIALLSQIVKISSIYKTESWGFDDDFFLNFVIQITTNFSEMQLIKKLLKIEYEMGRFRINNKYESRIIDIDILFFDDKIIDAKNLTVPHPNLYYRNFVLVPLFEIAPKLICPMTKKHISHILENCNDDKVVEKFYDIR